MTTEEIYKLERNIPLIYWLKAMFAFMILMPVITVFFQSRGLDMKGLFLLQSIFSIALLILELPSGYIADFLGRRKTLMIASLFWGIGYSIFPFSDSFFDLAVAEIFMALGLSLASGTDIAVIYDSLDALGSKKAPIKIVGRTMYYQQLGEAIAGLIGGWLIYISIEAPVIIQAVVAWIPLFVAFFIFEPPRPLMDKKSHKENFAYIYRSVFGHSKLLTLVVLNLIIFGVGTLIAAWCIQKVWQERDIPVIYFGYLWAAMNYLVAITARKAHKIEKHLGSSKTMLLMGTMPAVGYLGLALITGWWIVLFGTLFYFCRGIYSVILKDALNRRVTGDLRATANSIAGLGVRLMFVVMGPTVGYLIDDHGSDTAFLILSGIYVMAFLLLILPLLRQSDSFQGHKA